MTALQTMIKTLALILILGFTGGCTSQEVQPLPKPEAVAQSAPKRLPLVTLHHHSVYSGNIDAYPYTQIGW